MKYANGRIEVSSVGIWMVVRVDGSEVFRTQDTNEAWQRAASEKKGLGWCP